MKLGILDIGTNSVHLILVEIKKNFQIQILDKAKEFCRLGENTFQSHTLSEAAMERGLTTLKRFKKLADIRGVQKIKAVATSAVREASNGGDFINLIEQELNIKVKVITGEEEARLIYLAVKEVINLDKKNSLIIDIGGGSVELIVANQEEKKFAQSFKLGTIRLKEKYLNEDPPLKKNLEALHLHLEETFKPLLKNLQNFKIARAIGTSGSILNLVEMLHLQKHNQEILKHNNYKVKSSDLWAQHLKLIKTDAKERLKIKGLDPKRQDLIIPASVVLNTLLKKLKIPELVLCEDAVREGMIFDYVERNKKKIEFENEVPNLRLRSVLKLAQKCNYRAQHAKQVSFLALKLFDATQHLHKLDGKTRELLDYAALLHDVGYHISHKKHHKHSYYLISHGNLNGFEEREVQILALIARYHHQSTPKKSHENFNQLTLQEQKRVQIAASLLRIADGLDRSHFSVVKDIECKWNKDSLKIRLITQDDPELEIWAAQKKKDLFEECFMRKVEFVV